MEAATPPRRNRLHHLAAAGLAIAAGLASRKYPWLFPSWVGKYPGDALWAMMVFCGLGMLLPTGRTLHLAGLALGISYGVELSQLYHAPAIDGIRATKLGHLVLGSTFAWLDLVAYTVGVALAAILDRRLANRSP